MIRASTSPALLVVVVAAVGCAGRLSSVACVRDADCDGICVQGACVEGDGGEGEGEGEEGEGEEGEGEGEEGEGEAGEGEGEGPVVEVLDIESFAATTQTVEQNTALQLRWQSNAESCEILDGSGASLFTGADDGLFNTTVRAGPRSFVLRCRLRDQVDDAPLTLTPTLPQALRDTWVRDTRELRVELAVTSPDVDQPPLVVALPLAQLLAAADLSGDFDRNTLRVVVRGGAEVDAYFDDDVLFFADAGDGTYDVFVSATPGPPPAAWVTRSTSSTAALYDVGGTRLATFSGDLGLSSEPLALVESGLRVATSGGVHRSATISDARFDSVTAPQELMATPSLGLYAAVVSAGDVDVHAWVAVDDRSRAVRLLTRVSANVAVDGVAFSRFVDFDVSIGNGGDDPARCDSDVGCAICGDGVPETCAAWIGGGADEARVGDIDFNGTFRTAWIDDSDVSETSSAADDNALRLRWQLPGLAAGAHVDVDELFVRHPTDGDDLDEAFANTSAAARELSAATVTPGAVWRLVP